MVALVYGIFLFFVKTPYMSSSPKTIEYKFYVVLKSYFFIGRPFQGEEWNLGTELSACQFMKKQYQALQVSLQR